MANNFTKDRNCVALWTFENTPGLLEDSINAVTADSTTASVVAELTIIKEGTVSLAVKSGQVSYNDTSLITGFPLRYADGASAKKDFTIAFWVYFLDTAAGSSVILEKSQWVPTNQFGFSVLRTSDGRLWLAKGFGDGVPREVVLSSGVMTKDTWYFVGWAYQNYDQKYHMLIWDDTAGDYVQTPSSSFLPAYASNTYVPNVSFKIGNTLLPGNFIVDELLIFNRRLSIEELNRIRKETYNRSNFGNLSIGLLTNISMDGGG